MVRSSIGRWFESGSKDFFLHENSEEAGVLSAPVLERIVILIVHVECPAAKKENPSSRIRTSDLWMTTPLQSTALPTELSKDG